jgi:hypothetical protein
VADELAHVRPGAVRDVDAHLGPVLRIVLDLDEEVVARGDLGHEHDLAVVALHQRAVGLAHREAELDALERQVVHLGQGAELCAVGRHQCSFGRG